MPPYSRAQGWGRAGKVMSGLLSNPRQCPDPGAEQGYSARVNKPDSCHPKNRSSSIHPWPACQCWPAQAQTAQGLVLLGQTPGSLLQPCPGLAPFGSTAIARGPNPPQESFSPIRRQSQSLPSPGPPMPGIITSTSIFSAHLVSGTSKSWLNTDLHL